MSTKNQQETQSEPSTEKSAEEPNAPQVLNSPRVVPKKKKKAPKQPVPMPEEVIVIGEDPKPEPEVKDSPKSSTQILAETVASKLMDPAQEVREELVEAVKTIDEEINGLNEKLETIIKSLRPVKSDQFYEDQLNLLKFKEIKEEEVEPQNAKPPEKAAMRLGTKALFATIAIGGGLFLWRCVEIWREMED